MTTLLNFVIQSKNMAIFFLEISETNQKIKKMAGLDLNNNKKISGLNRISSALCKIINYQSLDVKISVCLLSGG